MTKINVIEKQMEKQNKKIIDMKKIINSQKKIINNTKYEKCNITNNTIAFGKEDLSFISDAVYRKILNKGYVHQKH